MQFIIRQDEVWTERRSPQAESKWYPYFVTMSWSDRYPEKCLSTHQFQLYANLDAAMPLALPDSWQESMPLFIIYGHDIEDSRLNLLRRSKVGIGRCHVHGILDAVLINFFVSDAPTETTNYRPSIWLPATPLYLNAVQFDFVILTFQLNFITYGRKIHI